MPSTLTIARLKKYYRCLHEAGHAVSWHALGGIVERVERYDEAVETPMGDALGLTAINGHDQPWLNAFHLSLAVETLAGMAAQGMGPEDITQFEEYEEAVRQLAVWMFACGFPPRYDSRGPVVEMPKGLMDKIIDWTYWLVARPKVAAAIDSLTAALMRRKVLTGKRVAEVCESTGLKRGAYKRAVEKLKRELEVDARRLALQEPPILSS